MPLAGLMLHLEPVDKGKLQGMQQAATEHLKQLVGRIGYRDLSSSEASTQVPGTHRMRGHGALDRAVLKIAKGKREAFDPERTPPWAQADVLSADGYLKCGVHKPVKQGGMAHQLLNPQGGQRSFLGGRQTRICPAAPVPFNHPCHQCVLSRRRMGQV